MAGSNSPAFNFEHGPGATLTSGCSKATSLLLRFLKFVYLFKTMSEDVQRDAPARSQDHGGARRKADYIALTKAARARFDTLAAESIEAVFQAVLTAATQDGDMAAAKLLIDRIIPSRRGAPVSFHIRPLKTPEDCALAYADLLDDVGAGRLTPEEAQTISAIVAKRAELFASVELAVEIEALKAQLAAVVGAARPPIQRPFAITDHLSAHQKACRDLSRR